MDWELVPQDFSFLILCRSTDGTEQERPRGAAPSPRSGAAAALCWSSREEISHAQGKRNLSKTVSTERGHQRADRRKHNHRQLANLIAWTTALSNSIKLSHACGVTKTDGSWWRVLTECGPLEKGMANHFSILALRTPWTVWKGKMIGYWKRNSKVSRCPMCYWRSVEK